MKHQHQRQRPQPRGPVEDAHEVAVSNTLRWAQEAAGRGEFGEALEWLRMIEVMGDELPDPFREHRASWIAARAAGGPPSSSQLPRPGAGA